MEEDRSDDESIQVNDKENLKKKNEIQDVQEDPDTEDEEEQVTEDEDDPATEDEEDEEEEISERIANRDNATENKSMFQDFEDDDDEDEDDYYLQKFDETTQQQIIADFHPELKSHNYDEIATLSRIVRDENGNIIDPLHKTLPFITRYEKARILGERAKQINSGAKPFIEVENNIIDGYLIALKEFEEKKIPFIIKRPIPNGCVEYWRLEDLEVLV
jgi:DNA-directed RNA polymerase I, II, and III subunit RPABC2